MSTTATDRTSRIGDVGIKAPCVAASTAALTLSGEQTIDGVACVTGDRVLVKNQSSSVNNGIYVVDTGSWSRSTDCDGSYDLANGTLIKVNSGSTNSGFWYASGTNPIQVGTDAVTFGQASTVLAVVSAFMQTMLDDADAPAARATIGAMASDLTTLTALTAPANDDLLPTWDTSASALRKITWANALKVINTLATLSAPATDDVLPIYDTSGTSAAGITLNNMLAVINSLTEDTAPDKTADFLLSYDTSASAVKKVKPQNIGVTSMTMSTTTGGTAVGFTGIPTGVKRVSMLLAGVSFNGTAAPIVQIGDSGGYENAGYVGGVGSISGAGTAASSASGTDGVGMLSGWPAASVFRGRITLDLVDAATNLWAWTLLAHNTDSNYMIHGAGTKALSATLDRIQLTTVAGTATIDINSGVQVLYE